jgi:DNA-directed RNA polymerase specialized sigma24 family protein
MIDRAAAYKAFFISHYSQFNSFARSMVGSKISARNLTAEAMFMLREMQEVGAVADLRGESAADPEWEPAAEAFLYATIRRNCTNYLLALRNTPAGERPQAAYRADVAYAPVIPGELLQALVAFMDAHDDDR